MDNSGPAFPARVEEAVPNTSTPFHTVKTVDYPGMSLRDWLAGQALMGLLADPHQSGASVDFARNAYGFADAMLAVRTQGEQK